MKPLRILNLRSAHQLPMLPREKTCCTENRKEECWIFNFRYNESVADVTQGMSGAGFHKCVCVYTCDFMRWGGDESNSTQLQIILLFNQKIALSCCKACEHHLLNQKPCNREPRPPAHIALTSPVKFRHTCNSVTPQIHRSALSPTASVALPHLFSSASEILT